MRNLRRRWGAPVLIVMAAAAACGGAENVAAVKAEAVSVESDPSATAPDDDRDPANGDDEAKDLDDYLGRAASIVRAGTGNRGGGLTGDDSDELIEEQRLVEQAIQACMQAQGFTYVPAEVGAGLALFLQAESEGISEAAYASTHGFGISTRFDAILDGEVDLSEDVDPNDEHLSTLSDGEADAWQLALRGQPPERNDEGQLVDAETGEAIVGRGRGAASGCTGEAQTTVRGDFSALADLRDEFVELDERIESDPRVAQIRRAWVDCMRAEGFEFDDEADARASINEQMRPLLRSFFAPSANTGGEGQQSNPRQGQGNIAQAVAGLQLSPAQEVELETLQELERSIATASLMCAGDTAPEVEEITARYEAEFVAANREALEAFGN